MSNYVALYRKWRPRNFADLVGQEHVARTLSNAITSGQLAHAYLFTGPRGTGKTSSARIFAKSLNCAQGPTVTPCEECPACLGITKGSFPDVIEIDAASNRGVDDARDLRDRVRFAPTHGRFKVFIIDEVHMLTNEAFNALLKTIEEPPPNLVFVLATTDVHKVLPTIISRCQRFDFQRIPFKLLVSHLRHVAQEESMVVADVGVEAIAKRADGGLRDALSLLDQVRACASSQTISAEDVYGALGIVSNEAVSAIATAIADSQIVAGIEGIQALLGSGYDHHAVVRELVEFFRNLMLTRVAGDRSGALEVPEAQLDALRSLAQRFTTPEVLYVLEVLRETEAMLKGSNQMTIWLEMAAIRLCNRQDIPSIAELTRRVAALEERLASGTPVPAPARPAARPIAPAGMTPASAQVPAAAPSPPPQAPVPTSPAASLPSAIEATVPPPVPVATGDDALAALLPALARVHRSTHSLVEQHALYARLDGETLTLGIKATMRSFFEKADRKAYLDKAVAQAFPPGVRLSLSFEQGDSARPKSAGAPPAPASFPQPDPLAPPAASVPAASAHAVRETLSTAILDPFASDDPMGGAIELAEPPAPFEAAPERPAAVSEEPAPAPVPRPAPINQPAKTSDASQPVSLPGDELVNRAADIFNGRVIEPTL